MKTISRTIRHAGFADASGIYKLIKANPNELVPRSMNDIIQNVDRFIVAVAGGRLAGIVSWAILPEIGRTEQPTVEIKSLAVDQAHRGRGLGRALVNAAIERIRPLQPEQIIVLTFTPEFFARFGFKTVAKETLMHKLYTGCLNCSKYDSPFTCPEVAMRLRLAPRAKSRR
ncbi:MAG: GNAT family N-acetyltransferase [Kiritimatiellaeota bacterium]|nr:GNAT family N-acetyltransferase [Kiritimatiellota bacterium]